MIVWLDARQQCRHRHGAITHRFLVGNVFIDLNRLCFWVLEQFFGLPGACVLAQLQHQLRGI
jgi:hypothetical protein